MGEVVDSIDTRQSEIKERREIMQQIAQGVLSEARNIIETKGLNTEPQGTNFAWTFFGTEIGKGYTPSYAATRLQAAAQGQPPPDFFGQYARLEQEQDPTARAQLEAIRENDANTLEVSFSNLTQEQGLTSGASSNIGHNLTNHFLQKLGFLREGEQVKDPVAEQSGGRFSTIGTDLFRVPHPNLPATAECRVEGITPDRKPQFKGFNIRYTPATKAS